MSKNKSGGGGGAIYSGTNYQSRVAAWAAVQILAELDVTPPWNLPANVALDALQAESQSAIDDLVVTTSVGGRALTQSKHAVTLSSRADSDLGSTISQFVAEFSANQNCDPTKDRFILTTTSLSSAPIKTHLPAFLTRMRTSPDPAAEWTTGNQDVQNAARVARNHIVRAWQTACGEQPSDVEIQALLRCVHIHILDVDPDGANESEAKNTLRQRILKDPTQADAAWNTLVTEMGVYAANHQRANRRALQECLIRAGFDLQVQRSYREDIERLKNHSETVLSTLLDFSRISVGGDIVRIDRPATAEVRHAAAHGNLLILGIPGAGKSGILFEFANQLRSGESDFLLLAVDHLEAASIGTLRTELGLVHDIVEVLKSWPGTRAGYIIIDALDAARTEGAIQTLQLLIQQVTAASSRWRVVASVRKFDLRHNTTLQHLFTGSPPSAFRDDEFKAIRHVNVSTLSDDELSQASNQSPVLNDLMTSAPRLLLDLLRVPFNLRLLAELLTAGLTPSEIQPVATQVELLDRYWRERVIRHDSGGDGRELVLRRTTHCMVQSRKLRSPRDEAIGDDSASAEHLHELLRTHVLAERTTESGTVRRESLTFPHHLLFDYAVARLYVCSDPDELIKKLISEPDLLIAIRPSIELHYQRLWHEDRAEFWDLTRQTLASTLPEVGKLIGPSVAALRAATIDDTRPILDALNDPARRVEGLAVIQHVYATLATGKTVPEGPWIVFLDKVGAGLTREVIHSLRPFALQLSATVCELSDVDKACFGNFARCVLSYSLVNDICLLQVNAIDWVVKTLETEAATSIALLRECIAVGQLSRWGYQTLLPLAEHVPALTIVDETFVRDLYIAAFTQTEASQETTTMSGSQILSLTSTRMQDYGLGLWRLGEHFPLVMRTVPHEAIDILLSVVPAHVKKEHHPSGSPVPVTFDDIQSSMITDGSAIWDHNLASQYVDCLKLLNTFQSFLEDIASPEVISQYVRMIAVRQPFAVVWRRLLLAGVNRPKSVGYALRSLLWDHNILVQYDTTRTAGQLLQLVYQELDEKERKRIETAILNIPSREPKNTSTAEHLRDRLLGCLDAARFTTSAARAQRAALDQQGGPPENPSDIFAEFDCIPHGVNELLTEHGVSLDDPSHNEVLGLLAPVSAFVAGSRNQSPEGVAAPDVLVAVRTLANHPLLGNVHADLLNHVLSDLAEACGALLRPTTAEFEDDDVEMFRRVILRAALDPHPATSFERDEHFQESPSWSMPSARVAAAKALMVLAQREATSSKTVTTMMVDLSHDPCAAVRLQIASGLGFLFKTSQSLMWNLLEDSATNEINLGVLQVTLEVLKSVAFSDVPRVSKLTERIFVRTHQSERAAELVRGKCINIFVGLRVWREDETSAAIIDRMLDSAPEHVKGLQYAISALGDTLKKNEGDVRKHSFALLEQIVSVLIDALRAIEDRNTTQHNTWPAEEREEYAEYLRTVDSVAQKLFFSSGTFVNRDSDRKPPDPDFYNLAQPLLRSLVPIGYPHTAHYLLQTIAHFASVDPVGVLLLVGEVVKTSSCYGYQYESMGEEVIIQLGNRYLSEYRHVFRECRECHLVLMDILDVFVRVGWPRAHQLTYRLGEIYR